MRCGDHVFHKPSGETWIVAYVDGDDLAWCGWPDGLARTSDCKLVKACDDTEHLHMLKQVADSKTGRRASHAQRELAALSFVSAAPKQAERLGDVAKKLS